MEHKECEVCQELLDDTIYMQNEKAICETCFNNLLSEEDAKEMIRKETHRTGDSSHVDNFFIPSRILLETQVEITNKEQEEAVYLLVDKNEDWLDIDTDTQMEMINHQLIAYMGVKLLKEMGIITEEALFLDYHLVKNENVVSGISVNAFYGTSFEDSIMSGQGGFLQ